MKMGAGNASAVGAERRLEVRRGLALTYATAAYNSVEALIALTAGFASGSVALVGFGFDSIIEVTASGASIWRLHLDHGARRERAEWIALRIVGVCFIALAFYVSLDSVHALITRAAPSASVVGIVLAAASLVIMPLLARAKRRVAFALESGAVAAEAKQTLLCTYLSAILLGGLLLNAGFGLWWADPIAALLMVPIIGREGVEALQGRSACGCD
jgi:divalent metal cation (Fe/Co/Zn/Cd) transporter